MLYMNADLCVPYDRTELHYDLFDTTDCEFRTDFRFLFERYRSKCHETVAPVILSVEYITACWLFLYFLYRKRTFLKM